MGKYDMQRVNAVLRSTRILCGNVFTMSVSFPLPGEMFSYEDNNRLLTAVNVSLKQFFTDLSFALQEKGEFPSGLEEIYNQLMQERTIWEDVSLTLGERSALVDNFLNGGLYILLSRLCEQVKLLDSNIKYIANDIEMKYDTTKSLATAIQTAGTIARTASVIALSYKEVLAKYEWHTHVNTNL